MVHDFPVHVATGGRQQRIAAFERLRELAAKHLVPAQIAGERSLREGDGNRSAGPADDDTPVGAVARIQSATRLPILIETYRRHLAD